MKLLLLRAPAIAALAVSVLAGGQNPSSAPPSVPPASTAPPSNGQGKVIFSRSVDQSGSITTTTGPAASPSSIQTAPEPVAQDSERQAVQFTDMSLEVHLETLEGRIEVRAAIGVRNDGNAPLARIPLQISSSLKWEQIRIGGRDVSFSVATLSSDTDHTGLLHEAAVALTTPLAPGDTLRLDMAYAGVIERNAQRLISLGMPEDAALHTDWDEVSASFTGLRGFGNVVWYPVSSIPVTLGDGSRVFDEIGRHKLSLRHTRFALQLTVEFPHGEPPTVAVINGESVPLSIAGAPDPEVAGVAGVATATFKTPVNGFVAPSLFVADRHRHDGHGLTVFTVPDNDISMQTWLDESAAVTPFLQGWLGHHPRELLTCLDLPEAEDAPFETGALLATNLHTGPGDQLDGALVHALTHAWLESGADPAPAWLNEGLATFMESLWVEKRNGRERALEMLEADRSALALAEPSSPGAGSGSPLAASGAPVYYRTKAAYVFWMLRDLVGDEALAAALGAWVAEPPGSPATSLESLLKQAHAARDDSWLFADWIDTDKGLPDLAIDSVFPNPAQAGTWLVAVNVTNSGYSGADAPVIVHTAKSHVTERVFVPARGRAVVRLVVLGPPTQVQLNDGSIPETSASVHVTDLNLPPADQPQTGQPVTGSSSSTPDPPSAPQ
jgi:hypothetical protein